MRRAALAAIVVVVMVTAPACRSGDASGVGSTRQSASFIPVDPSSTSPTDKAIAMAQMQLQSNLKDNTARIALAQAYLQKARETADPSLYVKSKGLLDQARKHQQKNPDFWVTQGTVDLALHHFADGLSDGKKTLALSSRSEAGYGILVDADNELGKSDDALRATQAMVDIHPDLAALSRVSYARELRGDLSGAIEAMTQAVTAGGAGGGENVAYVQTLLGGLLLTNNQVGASEQAYEAALVSFPDFAAARAGQAQVLMAQGKPNQAADVLNEVIQRQPLETYAVSRGDALVAAGRMVDANQAYALVDVINRLFVVNGVNVDREAALFDADHHPNKAAVAKARKALGDRGSLAGHDVLAWILFKTGSVGDAAMESDLALSAGSADPSEHFHAAVIAMAQKNRAKATGQLEKVLQTNPRFSGAFVGQVSDLAAELGLTMPQPAR